MRSTSPGGTSPAALAFGTVHRPQAPCSTCRLPTPRARRVAAAVTSAMRSLYAVNVSCSARNQRGHRVTLGGVLLRVGHCGPFSLRPPRPRPISSSVPISCTRHASGPSLRGLSRRAQTRGRRRDGGSQVVHSPHVAVELVLSVRRATVTVLRCAGRPCRPSSPASAPAARLFSQCRNCGVRR